MNATAHSLNALETLALKLGLNAREYRHLKSVLGRDPSIAEVQMVSVMWSEHCSYKSSKRYLKKLLTSAPHILQGPGENAGLVELDDQRAIAFKVESHNHPSFVEPFQGAATGVGGILRDIFTMGARPIALANYLRFGDLKTSLHQHLLEGVVSGIAHYGNCIGVPTVGGGISSDRSYQENILVNVFALGVVDRNRVFKSSTGKPGQSVMVWGAKTGRDGIHGASLLASADFSDSMEEREQKIRVQVGDPFKEKCLMEACLEVMSQLGSQLAAIQDMGAAGITSSTTEICLKSRVGMKLALERVPMRETGMQAWEILLSESQERMLAIVEPEQVSSVQEILHRWGCEAEVIGETTDDGILRMSFEEHSVVEMPVEALMEPPPADLPEPVFPPLRTSESFSQDSAVLAKEIPDVKQPWDVLLSLLSEPSVASKMSVYQRYDSTVGARTVLGPGHEAAVLWVGGETNPHLGIAFKGVSEEYWASLDPKQAATIALTKSVRSLACVGAKALAYTDGVNMGNPQMPRVQGSLLGTIEGLNEAASVFNTPCIGGNVSLYNQTVSAGGAREILPTTFVVAVGKMEDVRAAVPSAFRKPGSEVWLLEALDEMEVLPFGSLFAQRFLGGTGVELVVPKMDLNREQKLQALLLRAIERGLFLSARDVSKGGLAVALAKSCLMSAARLGFEGDLLKTSGRTDVRLFGEIQGRVIVELEAHRRAELLQLARDHQMTVRRLGTVLEEASFCIQPWMTGSLGDLEASWKGVFR